MLCEFCRHDFDDSLTECPYCHKKVDFEAKSLTREERDNFAGTTIEMEGSSGDDGYTQRAEYQEKNSYDQQDDTYQRADRPYDDNRNHSGFKVYRLGGSLWTWIIFALIVLGVICFVLPTFLFIGIIGLVVGSIIIFLSKLFQ
ncbi:MAG: SdpI family protein [Acidaminococcaceae bacterium]|nr:SdpI family protein [Acidaminococcaceae bacterium]HBX75379.1 hypothetical protein [Acidaminococcaceae bacterium]